MRISVLAGPKGYQLARHKILSLFFSISFALSQMSIFAPQAQSQVPVGLGVSLGWMVVSGLSSAHANRRITVKNKAIDACNRGVELIKQNEYEQAVSEFNRHWKSILI